MSAAQAARAERAELTGDMVVDELRKIGFASMGDYMKSTPEGDPYLDFSALTPAQTAALSEVTVEDYVEGRGEDARQVKRVKFKLHDKQAALVALAPARRSGSRSIAVGASLMLSLSRVRSQAGRMPAVPTRCPVNRRSRDKRRVED